MPRGFDTEDMGMEDGQGKRMRGATGWERAGLAALLLVALALRVHGFWWDEGRNFHPDERHMVFVAERLRWPATIAVAVSEASPLNPLWDSHSGEPTDFAYGHLPLYVMRAGAGALGVLGPTLRLDERITVTGRALSVAADLVTLCLVWRLARPAGRVAALGAAGGWAVAWQPVQQAHFGTVDSQLTMWVAAALAALVQLAKTGSSRPALGAGALIGLAIGTKASAVWLLVPLAAVSVWGAGRDRPVLSRALLGAAVAFSLTNLYVLRSPLTFLEAILSEQAVARGEWLAPYTLQFRGTTLGVYQVAQQGRWFLGWPLTILVWTGAGLAAGTLALQGMRRRSIHLAATHHPATFVLTLWLLAYLGGMWTLFAKWPRYGLPTLPALLVLGGLAVGRVPGRAGRGALVAVALAPTLLWTMGLSAIYEARHSWLAVSQWMYEQVPPGAVILQESWDEGLPVAMDVAGRYRAPTEFSLETIDPYAPDTPEKASALAEALAATEWVALASPRAWGVLPRLPDDFPIMGRYYRALFDGSAGFEVAGVWRVEGELAGFALADDPFVAAGLNDTAAYDAWLAAQPAPRWWNPSHADESLSVYDHPTVLLFRKVRSMSVEAIEARLRAAD